MGGDGGHGLISRRAILQAAPFFMTRSRGRAQQTDESLVLHNAAGLEIAPLGDRSRPVLAVRLPGQTSAAAAIEFPEHAWGRRRGATDQEWFYRLYSNEAQFRPQTSWSREASQLVYTMSTPSGVQLRGTAKLEADGVSINYRLENHTGIDFEETQAPTCVRLYRPFTDVFLERTYVHHASGLAPIASETPERLRMNAEEWLPCRYIARCAPPAITAAERIEKTPEHITRYTKVQLADIPFLATESAPGGWVAATHTLECSSVFTNPARTCHHTDPSTPLPAQGGGALEMKFYLLRGSLAGAWARVSKNHAERRV
jgi:hypothetical protein